MVNLTRDEEGKTRAALLDLVVCLQNSRSVRG
jgi:hypothetical protein